MRTFWTKPFNPKRYQSSRNSSSLTSLKCSSKVTSSMPWSRSTSWSWTFSSLKIKAPKLWVSHFSTRRVKRVNSFVPLWTQSVLFINLPPLASEKVLTASATWLKSRRPTSNSIWTPKTSKATIRTKRHRGCRRLRRKSWTFWILSWPWSIRRLHRWIRMTVTRRGWSLSFKGSKLDRNRKSRTALVSLRFRNHLWIQLAPQASWVC